MRPFRKISTGQKKDFVKTLSLLIKSGTPINEAFRVLSERARSPILKDVLLKARERTEKGTPIYEVFEDNPNFEKVFSSFIRAGEESGTLENNLTNLAQWLERKQMVEMELSAATLYPKIILGFAAIIGLGLVYFVLPNLVPIFAALDVELPLPSRILLATANFVQANGLYILLAIPILLTLGYFLKRVESIREKTDRLVLRLPLVGDFVRDYQLTIISQLFFTLLQSGLMITKIIDIVADSTTNITYRKSLQYAKKRIVRGDPLSLAVSNFPDLYPDIYVSMITTGEETGAFIDSFGYLADFFSSSITEKTKKLPVVLEPIILIFIGIVVAFIVSATILPIYEVTQGF